MVKTSWIFFGADVKSLHSETATRKDHAAFLIVCDVYRTAHFFTTERNIYS